RPLSADRLASSGLTAGKYTKRGPSYSRARSPRSIMISSSLRTLDGLDASGSSSRISSTVARWRRCRISMIWLSRLVRWRVLSFLALFPGIAGLPRHGEVFRSWRIYSRLETVVNRGLFRGGRSVGGGLVRALDDDGGTGHRLHAFVHEFLQAVAARF